MNGPLLGKQGANIASASTVDLATATGNSLTVTGTTTITSFGTVQEGAVFALTFAGALTLTYNATSLILPTAANITTAAGDVAQFVSLGSGNWKCTGYLRADGSALVGAPIVVSSSLTAANDADYVVVASATFTDPTPAEGKGYSVFVRNGTATVGGVAYAIAGTVIYRIYHSGAWANYPTIPPQSGSWNPALTFDGVFVTAGSLAYANYSLVGNCLNYSIRIDGLAYDFTGGAEGSVQIADTEFPFLPTETHIITANLYDENVIGFQAASGTSTLRISMVNNVSAMSGSSILSIVGQCLVTV